MLTTIPSSSQTIWECALACALRRDDGRCSYKFGNYECYDCKYYIRKYSDAHDRAIQLLMVQAECEACGIRSRRNKHHLGYAIWLAFFLILAYYFWYIEKDNYQQKKVSQTSSYQISKAEKTIKLSNTVNSEHANIDKTLRIVDEQLRKKIDVNGDGLINCIDAAVSFYQYYPDKSKVCIEINYNRNTGMNHLFNCVYTDGVWKAVEPQAYWKPYNSSYWMWAYWGNKYDKTYNRDETEKWKKYAKK